MIGNVQFVRMCAPWAHTSPRRAQKHLIACVATAKARVRQGCPLNRHRALDLRIGSVCRAPLARLDRLKRPLVQFPATVSAQLARQLARQAGTNQRPAQLLATELVLRVRCARRASMRAPVVHRRQTAAVPRALLRAALVAMRVWHALPPAIAYALHVQCALSAASSPRRATPPLTASAGHASPVVQRAHMKKLLARTHQIASVQHAVTAVLLKHSKVSHAPPQVIACAACVAPAALLERMKQRHVPGRATGCVLHAQKHAPLKRLRHYLVPAQTIGCVLLAQTPVFQTLLSLHRAQKHRIVCVSNARVSVLLAYHLSRRLVLV
jgi:hypothetical protein